MDSERCKQLYEMTNPGKYQYLEFTDDMQVYRLGVDDITETPYDYVPNYYARPVEALRLIEELGYHIECSCHNKVWTVTVDDFARTGEATNQNFCYAVCDAILDYDKKDREARVSAKHLPPVNGDFSNHE